MKVKALKPFGVAGKGVKKGQECEVSERDARFLIATGKAVLPSSVDQGKTEAELAAETKAEKKAKAKKAK